jgi:hypothetical protein
MRLRTTAPPIFFVTVKPIRAPSPAALLGRAANRNPGLLARAPLRSARKSWRFLITDRLKPTLCAPSACFSEGFSFRLRPKASCGPLRAATPTLCGQPWSLCAHGNRDGAYASAGSVDRSVSSFRPWSISKFAMSARGGEIDLDAAPVKRSRAAFGQVFVCARAISHPPGKFARF